MSTFYIEDRYADFIDLKFLADFYAETWRPVPGWEKSIEVSSMGRVRTIDREFVAADGSTRRHKGRIRRVADHALGYKLVTFTYAGRRGQTVVHRLVALAFLGAPPWDEAGNRPYEVAHNNGRRWDNRLSNIRWATKLENAADKFIHGTMERSSPEKRRENCRRYRERVSVDPVLTDRRRERKRAYYARRKNDPAYRAWESERTRRNRERYRTDPDYRARRIENDRRCRLNKKNKDSN